MNPELIKELILYLSIGICCVGVLLYIIQSTESLRYLTNDLYLFIIFTLGLSALFDYLDYTSKESEDINLY
jgi:uncharacterized protein YybS (DUF2232 family)